MSENVSRLERLRSVREWLAWQLRRTNETIADLERQEAAAASQARTLPSAGPTWTVEYDISADHRAIGVHVHYADARCRMSGKRAKPISEEQARRVIGEGAEACEFCRPDTALGLL